MILQVASWWLASSLLGVLAFPAVWRIFHRLPDRGFGFSRALGLLGAGYILWLGASTGWMRNNLGGVIGSLLLVGALGAVSARGRWGELAAWARQNRRTLLGMEAVFLSAFIAWSFVRANNPEIVATEKPMELAFLNSILRSESFPPSDPWLSGYAISYYYFGYVLLGLISILTGVPGGVAFNLGSALWFALTALGSYAIVFNLLAVRRGSARLGAPLLGPAFVLIGANLEGFLEVLHARHMFWRAGPGGEMTSTFWAWLGIKQLDLPPIGDPGWMPGRFWWWWRASRVVRDINLAGVDVEVIDEFPFFSFLLADNHPHVLALPFALAAVAFALQVFLARNGGLHRHGERRLSQEIVPRLLWGGLALVTGVGLTRALVRLGADVPLAAAAADGARTALVAAVGVVLLGVLFLVSVGAIPAALGRREFWLAAWLYGALAFLNTWDFPIYLALLAGATWLGMQDGATWAGLRRLAVTGLALGAAGVLFYLPWYPSFTSQAGGILPNLAFPTRFPQFAVMFGTLVTPIAVWMILKVREDWTRRERNLLVGVTFGLPLALLLASILLAGMIAVFVSQQEGGMNNLLAELGASDAGFAIREITVRRLTTSWTALALGGLVALSTVLLARRRQVVRGAAGGELREADPSAFVAGLIAIGGLLVIAPEFLYLKDLFGTRMNTVFKFYYAAWILWGTAAAYLTAELWPKEWTARSALRSLIVLPLALGLIYPALAIVNKTEGFNPPGGRTLDGTRHLSLSRPGEYEAVLWMNQNLKRGVVAEAVGGSYTDFARFATHTGFPTVLGWEFHEVQWRGTADVQGSRRDDIARLYQSRDWAETREILDEYGIAYIVVGPLERQAYRPLIDSKFAAFLKLVYQNPEVAIYATPGAGFEP